MGLIWQKKTADAHYQVRNAGKSLRLYTNGVFHSQYHPHKPFSGYVWDLLLLPVFFYPPDSIRRVLVLGVGGGAVFHSLRQFIRPERIVGVELDTVHVHIAKRYFGLHGHDIELHTADAVSWLRHYAGEKFDLIIDDVFTGTAGEPRQVTTATQGWLRLMRRHLTSGGMIVKNFADRKNLMQDMQSGQLQRGFRSGFVFSGARDQNRVVALLRTAASTQILRRNIKQMPQLSAALLRAKQKFVVRELRAQ